MSTVATPPALIFTVFGRPQPKGSKKQFRWTPREGGGINSRLVESNEATLRPWMTAISATAAERWTGELMTGPVGIELLFCFARPRGHYGTGRNAGVVRNAAPAQMAVKPDVDKLVRTALDALTGILFRDDAQVVELRARKQYGTPECMRVRIAELSDGVAFDAEAHYRKALVRIADAESGSWGVTARRALREVEG
jgi:Holliday junction resolvase RusA-like endonuclease